MAVCKNCGKEISKKASICPNCGVKTHPIRDVVKIVIIVLCVLIVLALLAFILSGGFSSTFKEISKKFKYKKYYGTYELVGSIDDYDNKYKGIIYFGYGQECGDRCNYDLRKVYTTLELKTQKGEYSYLEGGINNTEFVYNTNQDYVVLNIGPAEVYDSEYKTSACFKLDKEYLTQVNCIANETNDLNYIENIGLKYKKS